jgi:hypothetical protein
MRTLGRKPGDPPPPFRQRITALRYVPRLLRMVWDTHRGYTITIIVLGCCGRSCRWRACGWGS